MPTSRLKPSLQKLLTEIRGCRVCQAELPCGPRPILAAHQEARILIVGQAPGRRVHESGIAWQDASGDRLRQWMGISDTSFYDPSKVALIPMGLCFPGTGKSGDLPPRKECSELWHARLRKELPQIQLTLAIGKYAQAYVLDGRLQTTLTETVAAWRDHLPNCIALPHPSPRNNRWLKQNPWLLHEVIPVLQSRVSQVLQS